jgi:hypothetical protein
MATEQSMPESSPVTQQPTDDEAAHRQSIEIDSEGWALDEGKPQDSNFDSGDGDTVATESILPPVTSAILEEYQKENALKEQLAQRRRKARIRNSKLACCGIPSCLMLVMMGLIVAVVAGTIVAVLVYDPNDGVQPPSDPPSVAPSATPT